jgi:hypothetical protein
MSLGAIPRSKIRNYFSLELGFRDEDLDRAVRIIRSMDNEYLDLRSSSANDRESEMADSAKATDHEGVKRVLRGLGNRFKQSRKPKMK